jgi:hypothetical protein
MPIMLTARMLVVLFLSVFLCGSGAAWTADAPQAAAEGGQPAAAETVSSEPEGPVDRRSGLTCDADIGGEIAIRSAEDHTAPPAVRLYKERGQRATVRLAPGGYEIDCETKGEHRAPRSRSRS